MSHTVTITRTTVSTSGTSMFVNSGYLCTLPGVLKLAQLILGACCVGVVGYYMDYDRHYHKQKPELFFLLVAVSFLIGTFCLLLSCVISLSTSSMISKTIYELIYHCLAFILYLCAGLTLLIEVNHEKSSYYYQYDPYLATAVMGLVLSGLYLISTILANRHYRGI